MIGTGNLNWHRAICTARAVVPNQGRGLSRAAPQRFTSKIPLALARANDRCTFNA
jgi:hypothetical protein